MKRHDMLNQRENHTSAVRVLSNTRLTKATVAIGVSVALMLGAASAIAGAAGTVAIDLPTNNSCVTMLQIKPTEIVLSCADGNLYVGSIHWSTWGSESATGTGAYMENDCVPYCAADKIELQGTTSVTASSPVTTSGHRYFTKLTFVMNSYDKSLLLTGVLNWSGGIARDVNGWTSANPNYFFSGSVNPAFQSHPSAAEESNAIAMAQVIQSLYFLNVPLSSYGVNLTYYPEDPSWALFVVTLSANAKSVTKGGYGFARLASSGWELRPASGLTHDDYGCSKAKASVVPTAVLAHFQPKETGTLLCDS